MGLSWKLIKDHFSGGTCESVGVSTGEITGRREFVVKIESWDRQKTPRCLVFSGVFHERVKYRSPAIGTKWWFGKACSRFYRFRTTFCNGRRLISLESGSSGISPAAARMTAIRKTITKRQRLRDTPNQSGSHNPGWLHFKPNRDIAISAINRGM